MAFSKGKEISIMETNTITTETYAERQRRVILEILNSDEYSDGEKDVLKWQFKFLGHFKTALFDCIKRADENNLDKLEMGFPEQVKAFRAWAFGEPYSLSQKFRATGLDV